MPKPKFQVVVGNIGYDGPLKKEALRFYKEYVNQSKTYVGGRAHGEDVTLFRDNEIEKSYDGAINYSLLTFKFMINREEEQDVIDAINELIDVITTYSVYKFPVSSKTPTQEEIETVLK